MRRILTIGLVASLLSQGGYAALKTDVEHDKLAAKLGSAIPTGTNITARIVEGWTTGYMPDVNHSDLMNKIIVNASGSSSSTSSHATTVARWLSGTTLSMAPDLNHLDCHWSSNWQNSEWLKPNGGEEPLIETSRIQNHSWGAYSGSDSVRRLDYAIDRDGFTACCALDNVSNNTPLVIFGHTYNGIAVGRTDGGHNYGLTTDDEAGRCKPDIVASRPYCSFNTPVIGSCAAMLMEMCDKNTHLANGNNPQSIKAIILAGATKTEFWNWNRTHSRPLDYHFGAGELSVYNSYFVLMNCEQTNSTSVNVDTMGWDYEELPGADTKWYFFEIPDDKTILKLSAILTWHREFSNGATPPDFDPVPFLADMNLYLYAATNFTAGQMLDWSTSVVDNVEHIYIEDLDSGQYCLKVTSDDHAKYGLAWYSLEIDKGEFQGSSEFIPGSGFSIDLGGSPEASYSIEASTNLIDWTALVTNLFATNVWNYIDTEADSMPHRYYRAIPDP